MESEIAHLHPRQDQEAGVVHHQVQPRFALSNAPADEPVAGSRLPGAGAKADDRQHPALAGDQVAQLRSRQRRIAQVVVAAQPARASLRRGRTGLVGREQQLSRPAYRGGADAFDRGAVGASASALSCRSARAAASGSIARQPRQHGRPHGATRGGGSQAAVDALQLGMRTYEGRTPRHAGDVQGDEVAPACGRTTSVVCEPKCALDLAQRRIPLEVELQQGGTATRGPSDGGHSIGHGNASSAPCGSSTGSDNRPWLVIVNYLL